MQFTDSHFIYFYFRFFFVLIAILNGLWVKKKKEVVKLWMFWPTILVFTLFEGLRWGRGTDYNTNYWFFEEVTTHGGGDGYEFIWVFLIKTFGALGLNYQMFVAFLSFILITAGCIFMKEYKKTLPLMLPLFILNLEFAENLMRWYLGFSILLIGLALLLKGEQKKFWIFAILSFCIHYGLIINIIAFYLISFIKRPVVKPLTSAIAYLAIFFFFSPQYMTSFVDIVQQINMGTRFWTYQANAEAWLTGSGDGTKIESLGFSNIVISLYLIFIGYYYVLKNPDKAVIYNWALVGIIINPICAQIEIAMRIGALFAIFRWIYSGMIFWDVLKNRKEYSVLTYGFSIFYLVYFFYVFIVARSFSEDSSTLYFIWDANGKPVLS